MSEDRPTYTVEVRSSTGALIYKGVHYLDDEALEVGVLRYELADLPPISNGDTLILTTPDIID